jgi:hypothetical protein
MIRGLLFLIIACCSIGGILAENITLEYPNEVIAGSPFFINVTLINFSLGSYDIKIEIFNNTLTSQNRLSEFYNLDTWQSTYYYAKNLINNSNNNQSSLILNISKIFNQSANLNVFIRKNGSSTSKEFNGYLINIQMPITILYNNSNSTNSSNNTNQTNITNQNNTAINVNANNDSNKPYIRLSWNDEELINKEEFEITLYGYNLEDKKYDLRIWLQKKDNDTSISERYGLYNGEEIWRNGLYYISEFFYSKGNLTKNVRLRLLDKYSSNYGSFVILAKIRESQSQKVINQTSEDIEILEEIDKTQSLLSNNSLNSSYENIITLGSLDNTGENNNEIIVLGKSKQDIKPLIENSIIYKSKNEYIKEYAPYAFSLICIFLIIILIIDKQRTKNKNE